MKTTELPDAAEVRRAARVKQKELSKNAGPLLRDLYARAQADGVFRIKHGGKLSVGEQDLLVSMGFEVTATEVSCAKGK